MGENEELLAGARTLRRRARIDRNASWVPLLFFGAATAGAAPLYVERFIGDPPGGELSPYVTTTDPRVGTYWTVVLLTGALLTAWWYRRRGVQAGIEARLAPPLVAAALFLIAYLTLSVLPGAPVFLWPLWVREFTSLLVIAAGLLALAAQERNVLLGTTAALFTGAAVLANTYSVVNLAYEVGWDIPFEYSLLPNVLLPAAVLLVGAAAAGVQARRAR
jgi:hypothetical protein